MSQKIKTNWVNKPQLGVLGALFGVLIYLILGAGTGLFGLAFFTLALVLLGTEFFSPMLKSLLR